MNTVTDLTRVEFYQAHLNRVSRSFAFCIARLEGSLRERVGLSYLLCRLLDTIEDAKWETFAEQQQAFSEFDFFLRQTSSSAQVRAWRERFPEEIPEGERRLLDDAEHVLGDLQSWPGEVREPVVRLISSMRAGMEYFMTKKNAEGRLSLGNIGSVNRYCFFVAGLVGEILTHLRHSSEKEAASTKLSDAFRFGLFLQKINLLKDQKDDEKSGRFLVPSRLHLLASLKADAEGALRFLVGVPSVETGFRLFCAWSLFLGLASLAWIQKPEIDGVPQKISREDTMELLGDVERVIHDNDGLKRLFVKMSSLLSPSLSAAETDKLGVGGGNVDDRTEEVELLALYDGGLSQNEVFALFRASV